MNVIWLAENAVELTCIGTFCDRQTTRTIGLHTCLKVRERHAESSEKIWRDERKIASFYITG